jgi:hypothetical protein
MTNARKEEFALAIIDAIVKDDLSTMTEDAVTRPIKSSIEKLLSCLESRNFDVSIIGVDKPKSKDGASRYHVVMFKLIWQESSIEFVLDFVTEVDDGETESYVADLRDILINNKEAESWMQATLDGAPDEWVDYGLNTISDAIERIFGASLSNGIKDTQSAL